MRRSLSALAFLLGLLPGRLAPAAAEPRFPNVLVITVDTLRADRLSGYGYRRQTTPELDRLLASGVRFAEARTVEPLTQPALASLWTGLYPHEHGATRNGLRLRPGLPSLARALARRGYTTAAFVGSWPLRDRISGLGEHFGEYREVLTRKRWLGLFKGEATAEDLTDAALAWLSRERRSPFLLWVHYADPHAPYLLHPEEARRMGIAGTGKADRYDTEVAFADRHIGRLLAAIQAAPELRGETLVVFAGDHGESLGEHGEWGHGRTLYEPALRIPMALAWPGHLRPATITAPAVQLDLAPTVLGLLGLPPLPGGEGCDWTPVLDGRAPAPERTLGFEAHRGAVLSASEAGARSRGLLAVARLAGGHKEVWGIGGRLHQLFDLSRDSREARSLADSGSSLSPPLAAWMAGVQRDLVDADRLGAAGVDAESVARLRALGYSN